MLKLLLSAILVSPLFTFSSKAFAQAAEPPAITITGGIGFKTINQAMGVIVSGLFLVGGILAFLYFLIGAFKWITAGDSSANAAAARTTMLNAAIGLMVLAMIYILFRLLVSLIPGMGQLFG